MIQLATQAIACKPENLPELNLAGIVRKCRLRVAEQYHLGGDGRALVAVACGAVVLESHIQAGSLVPSALGQLREAADNLGTTSRVGADVVECCIGLGSAFFEKLEKVYSRRERHAA